MERESQTEKIGQDSHSDDNRSVRERMKDMTIPERIAYIWYYYKWIIIGVVVGVLVVVVLGQNLYTASHTNSILTVTLINADTLSTDGSDLFDRFLTTVPELEGDESVTADASLTIHPENGDSISATGYQVLSAQLLGGELDVLVSEEPLFSMMMENGAFLELSEVFPEETLSELSDILYYGTDKETGEEQPYGVILRGTELQNGLIYPEETELICGVAGHSADPELSGRFIEWVSQQ